MLTHLTEPPQPPFPLHPQPEQPHVSPVPPMVYVYERPRWEYKAVETAAAAEEALSESDLNALGRDGWELVGVVTFAGTVHFYFKRQGRTAGRS